MPRRKCVICGAGTPDAPSLRRHVRANHTDGRLTTAQLAARLGLTIGAVEDWRQERRGPRYLKYGGRVFYRLQDVDAWERRRQVSTKEAR